MLPVAVVVGLVVLVGFMLYQAAVARDALAATAREVGQFRADVMAGDTGAARGALRRAQGQADTARANTTGPGWWVASKLPVIGEDVAAVRTVSDVVDAITAQVLPRVVDAGAVLSPAQLRPVDGRVNLAPITRAADDVISMDSALRKQSGRLAAIDTGELVGQVRAPVVQLRQKLQQAAALSRQAALVVRLLPPMLGADGPRTYLVLFQNNAEIRATGGMPGALAILTARNGKIELKTQGQSPDLGSYTKPALPMTPAELSLFSKEMATFPQDSNFTPDFPRTGELVRAMWQRQHGVAVDGVLSMDPVALSYLLRGTGPVTLSADQQVLSSGNTVRMLLNDIYLRQPNTELQNRYFERAGRAAFDALMRGQGDALRILDGLRRAASERRILVWSSRPQEQVLLARTPLSGALPRAASRAPQFGVYFNDATGAKLDYYLDYRASVKSLGCTNDRQRFRVTLMMRSSAPDRSQKLPLSVTGPYSGRGSNNIRTVVYLYAPTGGKVQRSTLDGRSFPFASASHNGRPVAFQGIQLSPGQEITLTYDVLSGPGQVDRPELQVTPGVRETGVGAVSPSTCT